MVSFTSNKIVLDLEAISEQLKLARQAKGLRLDDIARVLNINSKYLQYLEQNGFNRLPAGVYGKNFLKEYAAFLDLDHNEIIR
ncbi:MAG: helix-turn-helix domain-containing protein, partial [Patescibacteria group bacterium]